MGVASLVLGIISLVIAVFVPAFGWVASIIALVGVILGAVAKKKGAKGAATAGLVMSIIALALGVLMYLACVACLGAAAGAASDAVNALY